MNKYRTSQAAHDRCVLQKDREIAQKPDQRSSKWRKNEIIENCIDSDKAEFRKQLIKARAIKKVSRIFFPSQPQ